MAGRTVEPPIRAREPGLFINRNFAFLWAGQTISLLGDMAFTTTLVVWVGVILGRGQPWAPLAVSGIVLAGAAPIVVVGPVAGVFVDRWDKRRTLLCVVTLEAVAVLVLVAVAAGVPLPFVADAGLTTQQRLVAVYVTVVLVNLCAQFFNPAFIALTGDLVDEALRPRAIGLGQVSLSLAGLLAPPLAAPATLVFGAQWAILFDALTFVVALLCITSIRAPRAAHSVTPGQTAHFAREFWQGVRFIAHSGTLRVLLVASLMAWLGGGALSALDIFFTTSNLHTPASLYGVLGAAQGAGVLVGAILASLVAEQLGLSHVFAWSVVALGVIVLVFARMTSFGPAAIVIFVSGIPFAALDVSAVPLILNTTPRQLVGRVTSLLGPAGSAAAMLGAALAGYLDGIALRGFHLTLDGVAFGPVDTIFLGAGVCVMAGGFYAVARLRAPAAPTETARYHEMPPAEIVVR